MEKHLAILNRVVKTAQKNMTLHLDSEETNLLAKAIMDISAAIVMYERQANVVIFN